MMGQPVGSVPVGAAPPRVPAEPDKADKAATTSETKLGEPE